MSASIEEKSSNIILALDAPRNQPLHYTKWLKSNLDNIITKCTTEFFGVSFESYVVAITEHPLPFWKENDYFVTQIALTQNCNIQIRVSNTVAGIFLDESLGLRNDNEKYFKYKNISKLEAEILSDYCEHMFKNLKKIFIEQRKIKKDKEPSKELLHLTLLYNTPKRLLENKPCGKIILSFPISILKQPDPIVTEIPVDLTQYYTARALCNIFIGTAIITLEDLKKLGKNDVLILDNSKLTMMKIFNKKHSIPFRVNPDQSIVLNIHSEDYGSMNNEVLQEKISGEAIWDNLQVEVAAEFKKIKLPLGELRNMTEGLVVEVASMVNNEVRLHIDGKDLALGELVIVGDKYGVMINKVLYKKLQQEMEQEEIIEEDQQLLEDNLEEVEEDDFNYDDLNLDDEF